MRIVEVVTDADFADSLAGIAEHFQATDFWCGVVNEDGRRSFRFLVADDARQQIVDALQNLLGTDETSHIVIQPVDAVLPRRSDEDQEGKSRKVVAATREELYSQISKGARLDSNFLLLTFLSTIVAAIGLAEDNVAVVVGAMVIAPLLGPNIALAFGASLGDKVLMGQALKTNLTGLGLALGFSIIIGWVWQVDLTSNEIASRTFVGIPAVVLALASGAAAVLSLTTGLSSTLVGVMVAVALLPPTATLGILLASGQPQPAIGTALLLAVNIVCVLLSAMTVFLLKGIRPRTWLERNQARQSTVLLLLIWASLLMVLVTVILVRGSLLTA
ncbi:MAG: TIGR00341 family protein [Gammaproteobacteria bacterium]|nr:TIGR00341 family protein [Gammaproteobacteria bacterium]